MRAANVVRAWRQCHADHWLLPPTQLFVAHWSLRVSAQTCEHQPAATLPVPCSPTYRMLRTAAMAADMIVPTADRTGDAGDYKMSVLASTAKIMQSCVLPSPSVSNGTLPSQRCVAMSPSACRNSPVRYDPNSTLLSRRWASFVTGLFHLDSALSFGLDIPAMIMRSPPPVRSHFASASAFRQCVVSKSLSLLYKLKLHFPL